MPTLHRATTLAKQDKLQAHWEVPGLIASVYNTVNSTSYCVYRNRIDTPWICTCPYGEHHVGDTDNICKHIGAVVSKIERETYALHDE